MLIRRRGNDSRGAPRWARRAVATLVSVCSLCTAAGAAPAGAASYPTPVTTTDGTYQKMDDPGVMLYNNEFYAVRTGTGLKESWSTYAGGPWTPAVDELSPGNTLPGWVKPNTQNWAPDITSVGSTRFVVYYSAILSDGSGRRCIGAAVGSTPKGPFTMLGGGPLACPTSTAQDNPLNDPGHMNTADGVIGPSPRYVTINGEQRLYLVYKTQGIPATIRMVRLSATDGTSVLGESHELLYNETTTIEAPSLIQNGNYFILFVAHGAWNHCRYATWWFKSQNIWSWDSSSGQVLMDQSSTGLCGPGTADVADAQVSGQRRIFFNGWTTVNSAGQITASPATDTDISNGNAARPMYARILTFGSDGYTPVLGEYLGQ